MRAGRLNRRITIQEPTEVQDDFGEAIQSWATYRTVWAEKRDLTGNETFDADQIVAEAVTNWRIRHLSGLTRKMQINYDGDIYDIHSIKEIGQKEGHEIRTTAHIE